MTKLPQVAESMQKVLNDVARVAGKETGFVERTSKLRAEIFVQTLVFGWMANPAASIEQLTQMAAVLGVEITPQGLDQRFNQEAANCLKQVLASAVKQAIAGEPVAIAVLERFTGLYIFDASTLTLPDQLKAIWEGNGNQISTNSALKLAVGLDYCSGELNGPFLSDGRARDFNPSLQQINLPKGALRLADLGYFSLDEFARLTKKGIYWLSRLQPHIGMYDDKGKHWQVVEFLQRQKGNRVEMEILLGTTDRLKCRFLAVRVPKEVAQKRRAKLYKERKRDRRNGATPSQNQLAFADWTVFVTNAPAELMSLEDALIIARVRWQIELLFKLWKSHGQIDEWRSQKPWRIMCEVYAKLIAMLIQHWILITSCWSYPNRSLFKAAQTVQKMATSLATAFGHIKQMTVVLSIIQRCLAKGCRINKRRSKPNTYQLLLDFINFDCS